MLKRLLGALFPQKVVNVEPSQQDEPLVLVFIPPLVTILAAVEKSKRTPLSETECIDIRDKAVCMSVRRSTAEEMTVKRGYDDVDVNNLWEDWQRVRQTLSQ